MEREELIKQTGYWTQRIQLELFNVVNDYLKKNKITRAAFAEQLGVSKGYVSQVLNGDFDHKLSKLIELALACGYVPSLNFKPQESQSYVIPEADELGLGGQIIGSSIQVDMASEP